MSGFTESEEFIKIISQLRNTLDQAGLLDQFPTLKKRFFKYFSPLLDICCELYSGKDTVDWSGSLVNLLVKKWLARSHDLKALDVKREADPFWYVVQNHIGAACYVDRFSGTLNGLVEHFDYLDELGIDYLHLMPIFRSPPGNNDGGYAVSSYREVQPELGNMEDLLSLGKELRKHGISLALDFVLNHTANNHEWAIKAINGNLKYRDYFFMYPDRTEPDRFEVNLREIFPEEHKGSFTWFEDSHAWIWTTFHSFQWDLNYHNHDVFLAMAEEMLSLANVGAEILRLDAVAFIWKEQGTSCENLPQAVKIIQAFNLMARIAAPALIFKSEAIVHPDDVARYIQPEVCQISYNPLLMAMLWNSLATRDVSLLRVSLQRHFALPNGTAWVNYLRCHDDIGWTFADEDAWSLGINPYDHRCFLNAFYTGKFEGSFARGLPFQSNPNTGDSRISGTLASLAGLEKALNEETTFEVDLSLKRILMLYAIVLTLGGVPLFYLGDELGQLSDYGYLNNPSTCADSRWIHRPVMDWNKAEKRLDPQSIESILFQGIKRLIDLRKASQNLVGANLMVLDIGNHSVLGYVHGEQSIFFVNFTERKEIVKPNSAMSSRFFRVWKDLLTGSSIDLQEDIVLNPYQFLWLIKSKNQKFHRSVFLEN